MDDAILTVKMIDTDEWTPVLNYPLPPEPSAELIDKGIRKLLGILEYLSTQAPRPPNFDDLASDINEAADRLVLFVRQRTELQRPQGGRGADEV